MDPHEPTQPPQPPSVPATPPPGQVPPPPPSYGAWPHPGYGYPPPPPPPMPHAHAAPAPPHVVQVTAKSGGFTRAILFVLGLFLFGGVFLFGIFFGIVGVTAGGAMGPPLVDQHYRSGSRATVAIIPVVGVIDGLQAEFVRHAVDKVLADDKVRAVVLRVNSPGGGVTASDQIWYQINRLKSGNLPVVASYGGMATSGGYYVSCHADEIVAEETCTTGSIGVIAQILTLEGLLDKVGIEAVTLVATGSPEKDTANDMMRAWNDEDRARIVTMLDAAYETFLQRVQDGRSEVVESELLRELANGSIYTAQTALENGLIDQVGYLDDAIAEAERLAALPVGRSKVVILREPPSFFGPAWQLQGPKRPAELDAESLRSLATDLAAPRVMYLAQ